MFSCGNSDIASLRRRTDCPACDQQRGPCHWSSLTDTPHCDVPIGWSVSLDIPHRYSSLWRPNSTLWTPFAGAPCIDSWMAVIGCVGVKWRRQCVWQCHAIITARRYKVHNRSVNTELSIFLILWTMEWIPPPPLLGLFWSGWISLAGRRT